MKTITYRHSKPGTSFVSRLGAAALTVVGVGGFYAVDTYRAGGFAALVAGHDCNIKGNISYTTGEAIYHIPGQDYYDATVISSSRGERWFCSEAEARQAGWRKAKR